MKNKKWIAYTVALNDLIRDYEIILERFEKSEIPLDEIFGSNTEQYTPHSVIMAIGSAVEPSRLSDILNLLGELGPDFLLLDEENFTHKKMIVIGSYNLDHEEAIPMTQGFRKKLLDENLDLAGLHLLIEQSVKVPIFDNKSDR